LSYLASRPQGSGTGQQSPEEAAPAPEGAGSRAPPVLATPEEAITDRTFGFLLGLPRGSSLEL
jgi:hypothetical protein